MSGSRFLPIDAGTVELLVSWAWLAIVVWLLSRALRQRGLLQSPNPALPPAAADAQDLVVVLPARNEDANIEACLRGLVGQDYPTARVRLLVVDDHSDDATAIIAQTVAQRHRQINVIRSPPLPPHWIGKSHACWIGACAAPAETEWLCFVDADVRFAPSALSRAIATATSGRLDLLSLAPQQELVSFAERLVMPCGLYLLAFCQDLREVQSPHSKNATATGQFMLVRRSTYEAVGGHAAIRGAICEDLELARLVKRSGGRVVLHDGGSLVSTRMYTGWRTLWPGVAKNLVDMLGGPLSTVTIAVAAIMFSWAAWLIPVVDAASCAQSATHACMALVPAVIGSAAAFGLHLAGTSFFRIPMWYGVLFPLGYTAGALMALDSVRLRWRGRVSWKGRTYP
jgi:chlorobactene glucosyltransferase